MGKHEALLTVEVRRGLRPAMLGALVHQIAAHGGTGLLVTDYVSPPLAEDLRARNVQFIDAAGNVFLNQPPLFVWVKGQRRNDEVSRHEPAGRAFQTTGLRVLFTLLCRPEAVSLPYRDIALLAGVAHGTVGWVMAELPGLGFLLEVNKRRRLVEGKRLLKEWVVAYARSLRPKLALARYHSDALDWTRKLDAGKHGFLLGGEPAASLLTKHLRPGTATFYAPRPSARFLTEHRLRPDRDGNVELLRQFWNFDGEEAGLVPVLLVYADLLATRDARCAEVAQELYGRIANRFE